MGKQVKNQPQSAARRASARHLAIVKARNKRIMLLTFSACVCLVLVAAIITGLYLLAQRPEEDGRILDNVVVGGVNIGGLTKEDAANVIRLTIEPGLTGESMLIWLDNDALALSPEMTGIRLDVDELVEAAFNYGRTGTHMERTVAKLQSKTKTHTIALLPYLRLNYTAIRSAVDNFCAGYSVEMVQPSVNISGQRPEYLPEFPDMPVVHQVLTITMGTPESTLDANDLYYKILDAYSLFQMEFRYQLPVVVAPEKPNAQDIFNTYCISPVDADLDPKTYEVTPEVYGYGFNVYMLQQRIDRADYGETLEITLDFLLPDITAEALAGGLFQDELVCFTATSTETTAERNQNLATACAAINGLVIKAGESFDLNDILGPRTIERGYHSAPMYTGSTSSAIGGGINQVASALYYCALRAGLTVEEHHFHRYAMSYTPMGTDAAMSNTENLVFVNSTSAPIRILAKAVDGNVTITFIGTEDKAYVLEIESVVMLVRPSSTVYQSMSPNNVYGYKDGDVLQSGLTGYDVETYLCMYDRLTGELVAKELLATIAYETRDTILVKIENNEQTQ